MSNETNQPSCQCGKDKGNIDHNIGRAGGTTAHAYRPSPAGERCQAGEVGCEWSLPHIHEPDSDAAFTPTDEWPCDAHEGESDAGDPCPHCPHIAEDHDGDDGQGPCRKCACAGSASESAGGEACVFAELPNHDPNHTQPLPLSEQGPSDFDGCARVSENENGGQGICARLRFEHERGWVWASCTGFVAPAAPERTCVHLQPQKAPLDDGAGPNIIYRCENGHYGRLMIGWIDWGQPYRGQPDAGLRALVAEWRGRDENIAATGSPAGDHMARMLHEERESERHRLTDELEAALVKKERD